jgi:hypothetical protein
MPEENKSQVTGNDITESQRLILDQMGGMEMAAVLMLSLNEEDAAQIFRHLEPKQVQRLGMSMASMSDFSHDRPRHPRAAPRADPHDRQNEIPFVLRPEPPAARP